VLNDAKRRPQALTRSPKSERCDYSLNSETDCLKIVDTFRTGGVKSGLSPAARRTRLFASSPSGRVYFINCRQWPMSPSVCQRRTDTRLRSKRGNTLSTKTRATRRRSPTCSFDLWVFVRDPPACHGRAYTRYHCGPNGRPRHEPDS
jgi:hypothetical protein